MVSRGGMMVAYERWESARKELDLMRLTEQMGCGSRAGGQLGSHGNIEEMKRCLQRGYLLRSPGSAQGSVAPRELLIEGVSLD